MYSFRIKNPRSHTSKKDNLTVRTRKYLLKYRLVFGYLLVAVGLFFTFVGPLTKKVTQESLITEYKIYDHGPITADTKLFEGNFNPEALPQRIVIPSVSIDVSVREARVVNGKWEIFEDAASFGIGSAMPGEIGNSVIFAHARVGYFLPLKEIEKDSLVYVLSKNEWYSYRVDEIKDVFPNDISVIGPTEDETLTLYTCSGFADTKRLIVVAKKV